MGVDASIHVGPYFKCYCPFENQKVTVNKVCQNPDCKNNKKRQTYYEGKFCPECGGPIGPCEFTVYQPKVNDMEVNELLKERLYAPNCNYGPMEKGKDYEIHLWCINIPPKKPVTTPNYVERGRISIGEDPNYQNITPQMVQAEIDYLVDNFSKERKILEEQYGKENVEVCWGVVSYAS